MKHIAKSLVVVGAMLSAGSASANWWFEDINPFIGADYYQAWMKGKDDYGQVFPKTYPGYSIYVGTKFCECWGAWGVELGFDSSGKKKKNFDVVGGSSFFGNAVGSDIIGQTKIRRIGGHLDLIGYLPLFDCFEVFGSIGYGWVKPQISTTVVSAAFGDAGVATALNSLHGKGKSVFRIGVGLSYMVTEMVGVRAKVGWETTSSLRVNGNDSFDALGFNTKGFKGSTTLNVGAFVKF
jgi:hypothetical protein